jgi:hypothetical protein
VFEIILTVLAVGASAVYVGYLAYAIDAIPLWVIVALTYVLAIREFAQEFRESAGAAQRNGKNRNPETPPPA